MRRGSRACACLLLTLSSAATFAHEDAADGAEFQLHVAKAEQHRLGIRTRRVDAAPPALTLPARVIADPRGNARVMPDQPGVLESPEGGYPQPGAVVVSGQVLAVLKPALQEPQRRDLESQLTSAQRDLALSRLQIKRYSIDEAKSFQAHLVTPSVQIMLEYQSALAREAQLQRALSSRVELRAPVSGRVLRSSARAGRIVAAGETLFELDAPQALAVEVLMTGENFDGAAANLALDTARRPVTLRFLGQAMDAAARTPRALYAISRSQGPLSVGEPLRLIVPPRDDQKGWRVPANAVFRKQGRDWVWLHEDAETFVAQPVQLSAIDSSWVRIDAGLQASQRIVVDAAQALTARLDAPGAMPAALAGERPRWLEDGSLFVPKSMQRLLDLRTAGLADAHNPQSFTLFAEVLPDPESRGSLKAPQPGRLEAAESWPLPGERVRKNQLLAWLRPAMTQREDAQRHSDMALLQQKFEIAKINSERLSVQGAAKEGATAVNNVYFEQAELERQALERQLDLAQQGLQGRVALRAPADGLVYAAPVRVGEVVAAGQPLFEISDSRRPWIAAVTTDPALAARMVSATARVGGRELRLAPRGVEPLADQQGWRLLFDVTEPGPALVPGQTLPLRVLAGAVLVPGDETGGCLPLADGSVQLWIHVAAERFERRAASSCADVVAQLKPGERRVVRGAALLAQYPG